MNEPLKESLSAMADGPVTELELHRVLGEVGRDNDLRARWARQHAVGEALRGEPVPLMSLDFADRIRAAVDDEPAHRQGWWARLSASSAARPAAGFAVAASVAMAVFLGGQQWLAPAAPSSAVVASASPAVGLPDAGARLASFGAEQSHVRAASQAQAMTAEELAAEEQRLQSYLLMHAEHVAEGHAGAMLPYARVTRYEMGQ